jgi:hypothetical protein
MPIAGKKWSKAQRAAFKRTMVAKKRAGGKKPERVRATAGRQCPWCGQAMKD